MVRKITDFVTKEIKGLHEAAYILAIFTLTSQFLGLIRDRLLAGKFGTDGILDIYYASFRIPDLIFVIVTFIVSSAILIPILSAQIQDHAKLRKVINSVFTLYLFITISICLLAFIFTPWLLKILMPGFSADESQTLILFTRILLLSPLFLGISQLFGSIIQTFRRFFVYAISPLLYNVGIIVGIIYFVPIYGNIGLMVGVVLGMVLNIIIQIPFILKSKLLPRITFNIDFKLIKQIFISSIPRSASLVSSQITLIVLTGMASLMTIGSITIFTFAYNIQSVPMAIVGVSYSLAAFPTLSRLFAEGNREEFISKLIIAGRHIIFWSVPIIALFIVLRAQIVRTILGTGVFSWNDTRLVAAVLAIFSLSVLAQSLILLLVRGYYAAGNTRKPFLINISSTVLIVLLALGLHNLFNQNSVFKFFLEKILRVDGLVGTEILILPLAFSLGSIINLIWLWINFEKDFNGFSNNLYKTLWQSMLSAFGVGYLTYLFLNFFDNFFDLETLFGIFMQGFLSGIVGIVFGILILILCDNKEIEDIGRTFKNKVWKTRPIAEGQKEL